MYILYNYISVCAHTIQSCVSPIGCPTKSPPSLPPSSIWEAIPVGSFPVCRHQGGSCENQQLRWRKPCPLMSIAYGKAFGKHGIMTTQKSRGAVLKCCLSD